MTINDIFVKKVGDSNINGNVTTTGYIRSQTGIFTEGIANQSDYLSMKTNTKGYLMMGDGASMKPTRLEGDMYLVENTRLVEQEIAPGVFVTKNMPYQRSTLVNGVIQDYHINENFNLDIKKTSLTAGYGLALNEETVRLNFHWLIFMKKLHWVIHI